MKTKKPSPFETELDKILLEARGRSKQSDDPMQAIKSISPLLEIISESKDPKKFLKWSTKIQQLAKKQLALFKVLAQLQKSNIKDIGTILDLL